MRQALSKAMGREKESEEMTLKHQPRTPVPWTKVPVHPDYKKMLYPISAFDSCHIVHCVNAYPKLVEALKEHAYISNDAENLLKELGELE